MSASTIAEFAEATRDFIAGIAGVPPAAWGVPRAPGKWSPSQEAEHITLAHEAYAAQLAGGPPMRVVVSGWRRVILRWAVLPWILRTGRFPRGARSPREARPSADAVAPEDLVRRLETAAAAIVAALGTGARDVSGRRFDHPYFGAMTAAQILRLTTVHTRHHRVAMISAAERAAATG